MKRFLLLSLLAAAIMAKAPAPSPTFPSWDPGKDQAVGWPYGAD